MPGRKSRSRVVYPSGSRRLAHRRIDPMTPVPIPPETAAGNQIAAGIPVEGARAAGQVLRSQANAPCL